ncbi:MAG: hypothetical protein NTW21_00295 [Verrucomicrobia bacterium]|nr:hypothetical protein [Verrucomicrobiota bacterium]
MKTRCVLTTVATACLCASALAAEFDYYKYLRYPKELVPGVGVDKVEQEGGPDAAGYQRRTVQWWPRLGQDIIDIPEGAPLRTWTRNKGQDDKEALAGISRGWMASDPETFKAHLVAFRGYGTSAHNPGRDTPPIPIAVLRMEDGRLRGVHNSLLYQAMVSREDHEFIHRTWEEAFPKLYATTSQSEALTKEEFVPPEARGMQMKLWTEASPKFNAMEPPKDPTYPRWGRDGYCLVFETPHFFIIAQPDLWGGPWTTPANWIRPDDLERQNHYRKFAMENIENMWTYYESGGRRVSASDLFLAGNRVPRYPWEMTLTGCWPGAPHRRQGDVGSFDDLYGISNNGNKFLDLPVKQEVPIPLTEKYGLLAQEKLAAMLPRFAASSNAIMEKIEAGVYSRWRYITPPQTGITGCRRKWTAPPRQN